MKFKCWDADGDVYVAPDDAKIADTYDHEDAAIEFAQHCHDNNGPFEELEVAVQACDPIDDVVRVFTIDVDYDPSFSATERAIASKGRLQLTHAGLTGKLVVGCTGCAWRRVGYYNEVIDARLEHTVPECPGSICVTPELAETPPKEPT